MCNVEYSLNFCSEGCKRSTQVKSEFNYHENRNMILFLALARYYHLHLDHYKLSLRCLGHAASEAFMKTKGLGNVTNVEILINTKVV